MTQMIPPVEVYQNIKRPNTITSSKMPKIGRQQPIEAFEQMNKAASYENSQDDHLNNRSYQNDDKKTQHKDSMNQVMINMKQNNQNGFP